MLALFGGSLCSFSSSYDAHTLGGMPQWFMDALYDERAALLRRDAWRSFAFIALGAAVLALHLSDKLKYAPFVAALGVLVLADLWPVDKRFFGEGNWVSRKQNDSYFQMQPYEKKILEDEGYFRVMNLTTNTFNESRTSYYLHSVGGYHAAKLRRYQDLIDEHLSKGNMEVINMLNTRYFIQEQDGVPQPVLNPGAYGNASAGLPGAENHLRCAQERAVGGTQARLPSQSCNRFGRDGRHLPCAGVAWRLSLQFLFEL